MVRTIGRYAMFGEIAQGGMARVHYGRLSGAAGFSRTVAIKVLHEELAAETNFKNALIDEARLAARIRHPNVVATIDVEAIGRELFVIMEYVPGESLSRLIRAAKEKARPIPVKIACTIVANALFGLHAAHEAKSEQGELLLLVHRDVSPHNILVGADGIARIVDFGVAKALGRLQTTQVGHVKGKLSYLAPEQVLYGELDARTDVYAAGVVLWEALTGDRLITGAGEAGFSRILEGGFPRPSSLNSAVTPALDAILTKALEQHPKLRFESARAFAVALEEQIGLATPRQVEEWIRELAGETLERRAAEVAAIEKERPVQDTVLVDAPKRSKRSKGSKGSKRSTERVGLGVALAVLVSIGTTYLLAQDRQEPVKPVTVRELEPAPIIATATIAAPEPAPLQRKKKPKRPNCDPAYRVDADGIRRIKPECL